MDTKEQLYAVYKDSLKARDTYRVKVEGWKKAISIKMETKRKQE